MSYPSTPPYSAHARLMQVYGHHGFGSRETLPEELSGAKVHCLENVTTMFHNARCLPDRLEMWLVPKLRMM